MEHSRLIEGLTVLTETIVVALVCIRLHVAFFLVFLLLHHSFSLDKGSGVSKYLRGQQYCLFLPLFSFLYLLSGNICTLWGMEKGGGGGAWPSWTPCFRCPWLS